MQLRKEAEVWLRERDIRGRIYVSSQGINAQYSGPSRDADAFAEWIKGRPGFQVLAWPSLLASLMAPVILGELCNNNAN